ncbi:MAG: Wzz/FepE/Etk N-terminal domain-containing protein [Pseudomonadota bacterium]
MTEQITPLHPAYAVGRRPSEQREGSFEELWLAVKRQGPLVALCALLGLAAGVAHYVTSPKEYYASATVLVTERQSDLAQEISSALPLSRDDTAILNEMQILNSLELASAVVTDLSLHENDAFLFPESSLAGTLRDGLKGWVSDTFGGADAPVVTSPADPDAAEQARILNAAMALRSRTDLTRVGRSFALEISYISHEAQLAAAIPNAYAAAYLDDGMNANLAASNRRAAWMTEQIATLQRAANEAAREAEEFRAQTGALDQQGLREREQRADALNELYRTLEVQYKRTELEGSFPVANGRILSQAIAPRQPALPKAWILLAGGLALGLLAGLGLATLRELRETGFRTGDDVRNALGLRPLGYLPVLRRKRLRITSAPAKARASRAPTPFVSIRGDDVPEPVPEDAPAEKPRARRDQRFTAPVAPSGSTAEAVARNVIASAELEADPRQGTVLGVTSVTPNEGASTLALNTALAAARTGRRTLLIDVGPSGGLSTWIGGKPGPGLAEVVAGRVARSQAVRTIVENGLEILTRTGDDIPHADRFFDVLAVLRREYDLVILDLPSLGQSADVKLLLPALDHVVLSTLWGRTPRRVSQSALSAEPELRRKVLGVVLTRTSVRSLPKYGAHLDQRGALATSA